MEGGDYGCVINVINAVSARNHHASWYCLRCKDAEPTYSDKQIDTAADTALIISYIVTSWIIKRVYLRPLG